MVLYGTVLVPSHTLMGSISVAAIKLPDTGTAENRFGLMALKSGLKNNDAALSNEIFQYKTLGDRPGLLRFFGEVEGPAHSRILSLELIVLDLQDEYRVVFLRRRILG